jgi:predicted transcriptional regulator of viral defense system
MGEYSRLRHWIDELPKKGKTSFSLKEAENQFSDKSIDSVRRTLARLSKENKIHSVWKGFYTISLPEYGLKGIAPPIDYIDQLMKHLDKDYYVALLTAASYAGASHQAPQVFQVVCDSILHTQNKDGMKIVPIYKKKIPDNYVTKINSRTASVNVSTPELTAIDLLIYAKKAGGINQVATVLSELTEKINFRNVDIDFFDRVPAAIVQRLGYLLDEVLCEKASADDLHKIAIKSKIVFQPTLLVADKASNKRVMSKSAKWKININYEVESDI